MVAYCDLHETVYRGGDRVDRCDLIFFFQVVDIFESSVGILLTLGTKINI
jgi:hypothetical protein